MIFSTYAINLASNSIFSLNPSNLTNASTVKRETSIVRVFEISQVPFAFEFESEWLNGKSVTKHFPIYHLPDLDKVGQAVKWQFRDKTVTELPFSHSTDFSKSAEW